MCGPMFQKLYSIIFFWAQLKESIAYYHFGHTYQNGITCHDVLNLNAPKQKVLHIKHSRAS